MLPTTSLRVGCVQTEAALSL
eukprot:COSAG05_NODE_23341_length_258_cov_1.610063_1_plen_20_part_01